MENTKYTGWYDFNGVFILFDEATHQHISNVLWFNEIFNNRNKDNDIFMNQLMLVLKRRFNGVRLLWVPLPIPNEIYELKRMGLINKNGEILGNINTPRFNNKIIGHINNEK